MTKVLITGITSYLGLSLATAMTVAGTEVHGLVRPTSDLARVKALDRTPRLHEFDGGMESLAAAISDAGPDIVIHLATRYIREHGSDDVSELVDANVKFGSQLLEAMALGGVGRFINAGSFFQYFDHDRPRALNLYAATKLAFEEIVSYYRDAFGIQAVALVLFDIYGPGDWRPKLMDAVANAAATGSSLLLPSDVPSIDPVYIDDAVAAFVRASELLATAPETVDGKAFAVSSGATYPLTDVVSTFETVTGKTIATEIGAYPTPARSIKSPWRGPALPGWTPKISLAEGVRRMTGKSDP